MGCYDQYVLNAAIRLKYDHAAFRFSRSLSVSSRTLDLVKAILHAVAI